MDIRIARRLACVVELEPHQFKRPDVDDLRIRLEVFEDPNGRYVVRGLVCEFYDLRPSFQTSDEGEEPKCIQEIIYVVDSQINYLTEGISAESVDDAIGQALQALAEQFTSESGGS